MFEKQINKYSLKFINKELEYEWRLHEIPEKHFLLYVLDFYTIYVDVVFSMILAKTTLASKVARGISTLICYICTYQIIYHSEVKRIKQIRMNNLLGVADGQHQWDLNKEKNQIKAESNRQYIWYQVFWASFCAHQALGGIGYLPIDPSVPNYEQEKDYQMKRDFFWVAGEFFLVTYALTCININYIFMCSIHMIWVIYDTARVSNRFNIILSDYILCAFASNLGAYVFSFNKEKFSKLFFLQQKWIQSKHNEQRVILNNLPDGAMIHQIEKDEKQVNHPKKS